MSRLDFQLEAIATGSRARAAKLRTLHNEVLTPTFMPVATVAAARGQTNEVLESTGSQVLLANTYHLLLRPGVEVFRKLGGIHGLMNWKRSVLTDSGGFQMFSLPNSVKMTEAGATFRSYVDGQKILLSPETSIETQKAIGSDIMMVLDWCVPSVSDHTHARTAMELTHRWAVRSLAARGDSPQSMFGIVQGACFEDLRRESADFITQLPLDGFAIGGLAVGETKAEREDFTAFTAELLPKDRPRYLMGVGMPIDILEAVHRGVDMFDCILPTSLAQQGVAFTSLGRVDLKRGVYKFSEDPLDPDCDCLACTKYTRAYLHHLFKCGEFFGWQMVGMHNLLFYQKLMNECRAAILNDTFANYYALKREQLVLTDEANPPKLPRLHPKKIKFPRTLGQYEVAETEGVFSIRHVVSQERMHSVSDPIEEARRLYLDQCGLDERVKLGDERELVIWDVGLGAAANAMAVVHRYEELAKANPSQKLRPVRIVSFENDLDSLRLALLHPTKFKYLRHSAAATLAKKGRWQSPVANGLVWDLLEGDFREQFKRAPKPDIIFYDPFSYKTDSELWSLTSFQKLRDFCEGQSIELYTYTASTRVRAAMLAAGFFVAKGAGSGPKTETTIAYLGASSRHELLSHEWLTRWERSAAQLPDEIAGRSDILNRVRTHPQFENSK